MKKILLLFVALITLSVTASAQNSDRIQVFVDGDWAFAINPDADHEVTVIHYHGEEGNEATELIIPSYATYNDTRYIVTVLGEYLFSAYSNEGNQEYTHWWSHSTFEKLEKVIIPNTVTEIGRNAFYRCTALTSVINPNSVTKIGERAFFACNSLTSFTIPASVTEIGERAFAYCRHLVEVTIPESVTKIGDEAFLECESLFFVYALSETPPVCGYHAFHLIAYQPKEGSYGHAALYARGARSVYSQAAGWNLDFEYYIDMSGWLHIYLDQSAISMKVGSFATLTCGFDMYPLDRTIKWETWATSNPEVATIEDGVVTAVAEGIAIISFTVVDEYDCRRTEYCTVTVTENSGVEGIEADGSNAPAEYYNLNGVRVNGDILSPGIYIKRQGNKATKVLVK